MSLQLLVTASICSKSGHRPSFLTCLTLYRKFCFLVFSFCEHQARTNHEDFEGPSKEEMLQDLQSKTKQLDHAQKVISEQQKIIAESQPKPEAKG